MNILLTGATGFIGKATKFLLKDHKVRLTARKRPQKDCGEFFEKEISAFTDFTDCLADIDVVVHTAARVHHMHDDSNDPLKAYMDVNCHGTLNLAKQAARAGVKRFIFISTMKVNGEKTSAGKPFKFDDIITTNDPYGISKYKAEVGLQKISQNSKLDYVIIRPPLVYGPAVKANFKSLLSIAQKNIPLPLGAINNKRSYVSLYNLTDLIVTCIKHPKAKNQIFLVSDDMDISTSELIRLIKSSYGKKNHLFNINPKLLKLIAKILNKESIINRLCDNFQIDIQHTKDTLNWKPPLKIDEGISLCTNYLKDISKI